MLLPLISWSSISSSLEESTLPLSEIGKNVNANLKHWLYELPDATVSMHEGEQAAYRSSLFAMILSTVYILGVLFYLFVFGQQLYRIWQLLGNNQKEKKAGYWLVWLEVDAAPCSFLNYLFLGKNFQKMEENDLKKVKQHEVVPSRQRHSLDLLMLELIHVFFWYNPFHRLIRKYLHVVHEYLADKQLAGCTWQPCAHLLLHMSKKVVTSFPYLRFYRAADR